MRKNAEKLGERLKCVIDFFYPPFKNYMPIQFFRYGFTGSVNVAVSILLYFITYNYILNQHTINLRFFTFSAHVGALIISFPFSNFFGFLLQKYITFTDSQLRGHIQLYRYFFVVFINLGINTFILKILVDGLNLWSTPSQIIATFCCVFVSYISQKKFTFNTKKTI